MHETTAETLLSLALAPERDLGAMFDTIATIPDEVLRRRFDGAGGNRRGTVARDLIFPVAQIHPALKPAP